MPRPRSQEKTKGERVKALPWAALLRVGFKARRRWRGLSEKERARLARLVRDSGGRPSKLSSKQRKELRALIGKLEPRRTGEELLSLTRGRRGARRCARRKSA